MAKESTFKNMLSCLFLICLAGGAALGGVYTLTKAPIQAVAEAKQNQAIAAVVPAFDNSPVDQARSVEADGRTYTVFPATREGAAVGYAIEASSAGFGGTLTLMVGFTPEGTIHNIAVLSHAETPGLGDKINPAKSDFIARQFPGKHPASFDLHVKQDKGQVDAITAATISSRAFCQAVRNAWEAFQHLNQE